MGTQKIFLREFQIDDMPGTAFEAQLNRILDILGQAVKGDKSENSPAKEGSDGKQLVQMANGLWRLRRTMIPREAVLLDAKPLEQYQRQYRLLLPIWDLLDECQIKIIDHTGEIFRTGMGVKPTFKPDPTMQMEIITDTKKPTIYFRNEHVQAAEVEVSTPNTSQ